MTVLRSFVKKSLSAVDAMLQTVDDASGHQVPWRSRDAIRMLRHPDRIKRWVWGAITKAVHVGRRSTIKTGRTGRLVKSFEKTEAGLQALQQERSAHEHFGRYAWKMPILDWQPDALVMPTLPEGARLDRWAQHAQTDERRRAGEQVAWAAFEIFTHHMAHRDLHALNCFVVDGEVLVSDFETMAPQTTRGVAFRESYDVVGRGLPSPLSTGAMCLLHPAPMSIQKTCDINVDAMVTSVADRLREELRAACRSFQGKGREGLGARRHLCKTDRIYGSFALPDLVVAADDAQRDSAKRFARFGVSQRLRGKRVLDLGSNVGAMAFSALALGVESVRGIEYDDEKVRVANRIARFAGVDDRVSFERGDIDALTAEVGTYDVVFCLAIEAHVKDPERLYRLLGEVTSDTLLFEGNAGCDIVLVQERLKSAGFSVIESCGMCDDDAIVANNNRPMLVARRFS
jgi:SAM-dependent methyltransferase